MSKLVAFAAIQGGYKVVSSAEGAFNNALESNSALMRFASRASRGS